MVAGSHDEAIKSSADEAHTKGPLEEQVGISFLIRYHLSSKVQEDEAQETIKISGVKCGQQMRAPLSLSRSFTCPLSWAVLNNVLIPVIQTAEGG